MKKSIRISKKVYIFAILLTFLTFGTCIVFGNVVVNESTSDIDQFKLNIQASPVECWRKPAENRKNTICNKLTELQQLITEEQFEEAYHKLLHDIKPKITGLKQNEHGEPWGNGVYKKPWVTCDELKVSFEEECNLILSQINPFSVQDDDTTPPTIIIHYFGAHDETNPGTWIVVVEDIESGIDEIQIIVDGNLVFHDFFDGDTLVDIDINVPAVVGIHTIEVIATNNDKDWENDQEMSTKTKSVEIDPFIPPPLPII